MTLVVHVPTDTPLHAVIVKVSKAVERPATLAEAYDALAAVKARG